MVHFRTDNPDVISASYSGLVVFENDIKLVSENITNSEKYEWECKVRKEWGHEGDFFFQLLGVTNKTKTLHNHECYLQLKMLHIFEIIFLLKWIKEVLIVETNKELEMGELYYGELFKFIRILLKIFTQVGFHRHGFWSERKDHIHKNPLQGKHSYFRPSFWRYTLSPKIYII